jgi:hypothetical protein
MTAFMQPYHQGHKTMYILFLPGKDICYVIDDMTGDITFLDVNRDPEITDRRLRNWSATAVIKSISTTEITEQQFWSNLL